MEVSSLSETLTHYVPDVVAAIIIVAAGFLLAALLRAGVTKLFSHLDARVKEKSGKEFDLASILGKVVFYLTVLYTALIALNVLGIEGVLDPAEQMLVKTFDFIPNLIAAVLIGLMGYIISWIVSGTVKVLASPLDRFGSEAGLGEEFKPSALLGTIVFVLVLVPVVIAALNALQIDAISGPAIDMLNTFLAAVPRIIGALLLLGVSFIAGRFIRDALVNILRNAGADGWANKTGAEDIFGKQKLSGVVGGLVFFFIMLGAFLAAVGTLDLAQLSSVVERLLVFAGQIVVGLLVIALGSWLANLAYTRLHEDGRPTTLASIARIAVLGFVLAFGLRAMGIGDEIVNLAFGLTLGAVAVAVALSFGLGGREAAGRQMEHWLSQWRGEQKKPQSRSGGSKSS